MKKQILYLAGWIILCIAVGILGGLITASAVPGWYSELVKPPFTPPNWLFGPVWTFLYVAMGVVGWSLWHRGDKKKPDSAKARLLFVSQLILNAIWTPVFFGLKQLFPALLIILSLFAVLSWLVIALFRDGLKWQGVLMVLYLCWVGFASYLNAGIFYLNQ